MTTLSHQQDLQSSVRELLFWALIGLGFGLGFAFMKDAPLIADEGYHLPQISAFLGGNFEVSPHLTVLPAYHAGMAAVLASVGAATVADARLVSLLISALSVWIFYLIVSQLWPEERYQRTARMAFLPILFPMHFVIYTDGWALMFLLMAFERCLAGKYWQSALAISVASLIRQPNIVWLVLLWIIANTHPDQMRPRFASVLSSWKQSTAPFFLVLVGFTALVVLNRGVAVGDKAQHGVSLNLANIWFFGLCFFALFLPEVGRMIRQSSRSAHKFRIWMGVIAVAVFVVYIFSYIVSHQYNQASLWFYLRNRVLHWTTENPWTRIAVFAPVFLGLILFCTAFYRQSRLRWIVPISLASILVMPLIEQRYYLVPVVLFLAFGETLNRGSGWIILFEAFLAGAAVYAFSQNRFFF